MKVLIAGLLAIFPACASAADWSVDSANSMLGFSATVQGEAFDGVFKRFAPKIQFDPAELPSGCFDVAITLDSVDTQNAERDGALAEADFFYIEKHPTARYFADRFEAAGAGFRALGELELRGVKAPVALDFSWTAQGGDRVLEGKVVLDRSVFGVGSGDWLDEDTIAHRVEVRTRLVLHPTP